MIIISSRCHTNNNLCYRHNFKAETGVLSYSRVCIGSGVPQHQQFLSPLTNPSSLETLYPMFSHSCLSNGLLVTEPCLCCVRKSKKKKRFCSFLCIGSGAAAAKYFMTNCSCRHFLTSCHHSPHNTKFG